MRGWKQSLRGVSVGVGVIIRRRLHLEDIGFAFKIATKVTLPIKLINLLNSRKGSNSTNSNSKSVVPDATVISSGPLSPRSHSVGKGRGSQLFQTLAQIISRSNSTSHKHQLDISRSDHSSKSIDSYFSALPSTRMTARQKMWTLTKVLIYSTLILQAFPAVKGQRISMLDIL